MPIGDLAVHEPDHKRLIAFLKAMEFTSLTRRVAEFADVDVGRDRGGCEARGARRGAAARRLRTMTTRQRPSGSGHIGSAQNKRRRRPGKRQQTDRAPYKARSPRKRWRRRGAILRARQKFDRTKYETVRSLDRLNAWIERARDIGVVAIDTETNSLDPMQAMLCGFSLALAPNEACYVPL